MKERDRVVIEWLVQACWWIYVCCAGFISGDRLPVMLGGLERPRRQ